MTHAVRLTEIEKLARDICWAEFSIKPKQSKAAYWKGVTDLAKQDYRRDAKLVVFAVDNFGLQRLSIAARKSCTALNAAKGEVDGR